MAEVKTRRAHTVDYKQLNAVSSVVLYDTTRRKKKREQEFRKNIFPSIFVLSRILTLTILTV